MISTMYSHAHILWQEHNDGIPELAIGGSVDAGGTIILTQEGQEIVVDPNAVNDLCRMLKRLRDISRKRQCPGALPA